MVVMLFIPSRVHHSVFSCLFACGAHQEPSMDALDRSSQGNYAAVLDSFRLSWWDVWAVLYLCVVMAFLYFFRL